MSAIGPKRTSLVAPHMSAFGSKADIAIDGQNVRLCPLLTFQNCRSMSAFGVKFLPRHCPHMTQSGHVVSRRGVSVFGDKADR
jgi:hypothetical protein